LAEPESYPPTPQPSEGATYAAKVDKSEARLDFSNDAHAVERQVRAFNPVPGAWFEYMGERIKIWEAEVVPGSGSPGTVADDRLKIACEEGAIRPLVIQRPGKSRMHVDEFIRGFTIHEGTILK
jgi:methionyl-tRNA formyltransferase